MKRDYCDLNVTEQPNYSENLANIKQLITLGYHKIALNRQYIFPSKQQQQRQKHQKKQQAGGKAQKKFQQAEHKLYLDSFKQLHERLRQDVDNLRKQNDSSGDYLHVPLNFQLLSRVTFILDDSDQLRLFRSGVAKDLSDVCDITAITPKCEKVFKSLMEGKISFDIISIPMEEKPDFHISRDLIGLGMSHGFVFEVSYSTAIKSQSLRKYVFSNSQSLVGKTKNGKGVIVSSGGSSPMDFRAPLDIANLSNLFGLTGSHGLDAVTISNMKCIDHALLRKHTFKGAVKVERITEDETFDNIKTLEEPVAKKRKMEE